MEMSREQITKALRCCCEYTTIVICSECPLRGNFGTVRDCRTYLMVKALKELEKGE